CAFYAFWFSFESGPVFEIELYELFCTLDFIESALLPTHVVSLMCGFLQRWLLRHSSAAFSVLEYIHPVSLMLAPHRHVSTACSLIGALHLVGAVFYPIAGVACCCYGVSGCVCPCAPSPVFGGFS